MNKAQSGSKRERFIEMAVEAWESKNMDIDRLLESLSEDQLRSEVAPGRNTGIYLLGHLTAASDSIHTLFGFGETLYPELEETFLRNPDKSGIEKPSIAVLKGYWENVNSALRNKISEMSPDDWFGRHTAVSEEDFVKEPNRNKLNLLIARTNHQSYHLGQLSLLSVK